MAVYIFAQMKDYVCAGMDYVQTYGQWMSDKEARYVYTDIFNLKDIESYEKVGIDKKQILNMHQYFTDKNMLTMSVKVEDKLGELKDTLRYTSVDFGNYDISLIKDGYVIATISLNEREKDYVRGVYYFSYAKLVRAENYLDDVAYAEYFKTARAESGLYAKLTRRSFYNGDGSVAFDQIFIDEEEWYLFPDGRRYTRAQLMVEFVKRMNFSREDTILVDRLVPDEFMRAVFVFGKAAKIVAVAHANQCFWKKTSSYESVLEEYPYFWFPYAEMVEEMIVSTNSQKAILEKELEEYHCNVPDVRVAPIGGEFVYAVIRESYGGNMALSWSFKGKTDGFCIYDESGMLLCETRNVHQHYYLIKGCEKGRSFVVKAFADTVKGKIVTVERKVIYGQNRKKSDVQVSLLMAAYNAEEYIVRSIDTALAQSFLDLELIIVDDGSTDSTPFIIDWYAEKYPNVTGIHQANGRTPTARNTGIKNANGNYIAFMDSDDMIHPSMIEDLFDSIQKNQCDIAITSVYLIKENGYNPFIQYPMEENVPISVEDFFDIHFVKGCMFATIICNKLYRAELVKKHLLPILPIEDEAWTPYILSYADVICYRNDCSYEYDRVIRNDTISDVLLQRSNEDMFEIHKNTIMFYLENGNLKRLELLKMLAKRQLLEMKNAYGYDEYEKLWKKIEKEF